MVAFTKSHPPNSFATPVIGLLCACLVGCGGEKPDSDRLVDQTVTTPALQSPVEPAASLQQSPADPPGSMEMPESISSADPKATSQSAAPKAGIQMPEADTKSPEIQYASWSEVDQIAKSAGKATIVDIWSVGCQPCIKELPGLEEIRQAMGDKVQCIALNVDYYGSKRRPPEFFKDDVARIIEPMKAGFSSYICTTSSEDVFSKTDVASIPAVLVYDASGKLVRKFVEVGSGAGFTYHKDIIPFINDLLK